MEHQKGKRQPVALRKSFDLRFSPEAKAALIKVAELQNRPVAAVVRTAVGNYLHELGIDVDMTVLRGGARKKGAAE